MRKPNQKVSTVKASFGLMKSREVFVFKGMLP
jgi:hypothetical protein